MPAIVRIFMCAVFALCAIFSSCRHAPVYDDAQIRRYNAVADSMYLDGRKQEAVSFEDSIVLQAQGSVLGKYFAYARNEQYQLDMKNFGKAKLYNDSAVALIEQNKLQQKYTNEYVHALLEKGLIFSGAEKYDSAYSAYMQGYKYVLKTGEQCIQSEFDYHIAMALYRQENRVKAKDFFRKSFTEACNCQGYNKPWYRMQEVLDNIALCYKGEPEEIIYYDSCISFIHHNSDKFPNEEMVAEALSICYRNKGIRLSNLKRGREAKESFINSINAYKSLDSNKYKHTILNQKLALIISLYFAEDSEGVVTMWEQLKPVADTVKTEQVIQQCMRLKYMYYQMKKDYENAYWALGDFMLYLDTTRYMASDGSRKDITQNMRNLEQDYKIQLLTKEQQLQRVYLWIAIGLSCLAAVIITLVYSGYKKTRKANELIGRQKAALETSNREKDRILHVVAHDLRNPIGGVAFMSDLMLDEDDLPNMKPKEAFEMIKASSTKALHLVDELLVAAKNDQHSLKKEHTDISLLAQQSVAALKYKASVKKQTMTCNTPTEPIILSVDKEKMERVLINLITNAIKFTRAGGNISVTVSKKTKSVAIEVKDNGIGIPDKLLPGLFELFTDSKRRGTANEQTFGLGLSICKQIVEDHGGTLSVASTDGEGSTFTIELPA